MPRRPFSFCLTLLLACASPAFAWVSPAPDVVLYCTPALDVALHDIAGSFRAETGVEVHIFVAPPDGVIGLIRHRARDDVVVADAATIAMLASTHAVRPDTVVALGKDPFVLVGRQGGAWIAGTGVGQLLATYPTVLPDPTTAASFDGPSVLHQDADAQAPVAEIGVSDTPTVIARVREDAKLIGLVYQTEATETGIAKAATLRAAPTVMSGALVTNGQSGNAERFLSYIAGAPGLAVLRKAGLEANP
jgi:ABC-type molybdate transport system substrate-binding protein